MDSKKTLEQFGFKLCKSLIIEGASYSSIILSKSGDILYSYSTNKAWDNLYHEKRLSKSCHLVHASKELSELNANFTLFWDAIMPNNEISLYLNDMRKENNVSHGVTFCKMNHNGILEGITLAGRFCDFNFAKQVINHKEKVQRQLLTLKDKYLTKKSILKSENWTV